MVFDSTKLPRTSEKQVKVFFDFHKSNKGLVREYNSVLRNEGWQKCAAYFLKKGITKR